MSWLPKFSPTVTVSACLIGKPPVEVVRTGNAVQVLDPANHPILYQRVEHISNRDGLAARSSNDYTDHPEIFRAAFQEAIDLAVKRLADSWTGSQPPPRGP